VTELERFKAVVNFAQPDYWPLVIWHAMGYPHKGGLFPVEQVCGDDLVEYRRKLPNFVFAGGIEKELAPKVPAALDARGYFPAFDHALSTNAGFEEHCICMTRLHELCGSADLNLGEFPRKSL